jgi:hypothetical protein
LFEKTRNELDRIIADSSKKTKFFNESASAPKTGPVPLITVTPIPEPVPKVVIPVDVPLGQTIPCPVDAFGRTGIMPSKDRNVTALSYYSGKKYSVREGSAIIIEGHGTTIILSVSKVGEKGVVLQDLVKMRTVTLGYGSDARFRDKEGGARIKIERGKEAGMAYLTIPELKLFCKHPVQSVFDILHIGLLKRTINVKANDKIDTCLTERITVTEINNKGIKLAGFGLLRYGKELRLGEAALVAIIKAERGTEKGTARVTVLTPDIAMVDSRTKP